MLSERALREQIARIIDPWGWDAGVAKAWGDDTCEIHAKAACEKADTILALLDAARAEGGAGEGLATGNGPLAEGEGSRDALPLPQQGGDLDLEGLVERLREYVRYQYMPAAARVAMEQAAEALLSRARLLDEVTRERDERIATLEACLRCDDESVRTAWAREAEWKARAEAAERLLDEVVGALEPFAKFADEFDRWQAMGSTATQNDIRYAYGRAMANFDDFRQAREALSKLKGIKG